jgi:hypothetical protein
MKSSSKDGSSQKGLWFSIEMENEEFVAFVAAEVLEKRFNAKRTAESRRVAYRQNRQFIDSVARRNFLRGFPRPLKLGMADFEQMDEIEIDVDSLMQIYGGLSRHEPNMTKETTPVGRRRQIISPR